MSVGCPRCVELEAEIEGLKALPSYGMGYWDAERSFMPMLERMVAGITADGEQITREHMRLMADTALRPLQEKARAQTTTSEQEEH